MKSKCFSVQSINVCSLVAPLWRCRYETTSSDDSSSEDSSSSGSDEEEEEEEDEDEEKEFGEKPEGFQNVKGKSTREEFQPEGAEDVKKQKEEEESSEKQELRERWVEEQFL